MAGSALKTASSATAATSHQTEHEAAVQIGPQRHQRQQKIRLRIAPISGFNQVGDPTYHQRHRQHMRPRQQMRHGERQRRGNEHERRAFVQPLV